MSKKRKSEFPDFIRNRTVQMLTGGAVLATVGLFTAAWLGFIQIPGISPQPVAKYEATVVISASGIDPAVLIVKPGTRIFFNNEDTTNHRIDASQGTPDSKFGSLAEIVPSTGYVFSFFKAGDYKYHDGNNPTANGEIIVK